MKIITFKQFEFLFDKNDFLIGILENQEVLNRRLQDSLENLFTSEELIDFLENNQDDCPYNLLFNQWLDEFLFY